MTHKITGITKGSIADEMGISPGCVLYSVNGRPVKDVFDYRYFIHSPLIDIELIEPDGAHTIYEIEKDEDEDPGLVFETGLMDKPLSCRNKCVFCFIDQNPPGMRESLYFKDDDPRLSFLTGNYVTLTNISRAELDRILYYHLSPVNISVHAANPAVRRSVMNNARAGGILPLIKKITDAGCSVNFQAVLVKGMNDGDILDDTITALAEFIPKAESMSVVPAGLTGHRAGLPAITPFTKPEARYIIGRVMERQERFYRDYSTRFVFLADEFYITAGMPFPGYHTYEAFYQIENGVGMAARTQYEIKKAVRRAQKAAGRGLRSRRVSVVTGEAAYPLMRRCAALIRAAFPQIDISVHRIKNAFFGGNVTVSGLLTGRDIIDGLNDKPTGDIILLPENALRSDKQALLDDITPDGISRALGKPVMFCRDSDILSVILKNKGVS